MAPTPTRQATELAEESQISRKETLHSSPSTSGQPTLKTNVFQETPEQMIMNNSHLYFEHDNMIKHLPFWH